MTAPTENTALLSGGLSEEIQQYRRCNSFRSQSITDVDDEEAFAKDPDQETTWQTETILLSKYSAPLVVTYVLQYSFSLVTVLVAGHLGTQELAAASLASMTANITGLVVYEGLATCLDTLTSQAYGGGKKELVGLHVQRMAALALLVTIPIGIVWACSPWILIRLVPEKEVALLAGDFLRIYLIGAPGYGLFEAGKRFTQAQGNFIAPLAVQVICAPLNLLWNWLFVFKFNLGFQGAAAAVALSLCLQPLVLFLYVRFVAPSTLQCWPGFQLRRSLQNWGPMVKLAVPGVLMTLSEWLAFDILTFSTSYLSTEHLAAQSVTMTISVLMYHIPFPISIAASTRFGNLVGYGALAAAKVAFRTYYLVFFGIGLLDIILLTSLRHVIAQWFTNDPQVRRILTDVIPYVAACQMFDAMCAISNGLIRGLGRQKIGGYVSVFSYYAYAIPLSLVLTFGPPRLELVGLWIGPLTGLGITALVLFFYMRFCDWQKAVDEAREREE